MHSKDFAQIMPCPFTSSWSGKIDFELVIYSYYSLTTTNKQIWAHFNNTTLNLEEKIDNKTSQANSESKVSFLGDKSIH